MAETNTEIRALIAVQESDGKGIKYNVSYYCDGSSSYFFTKILWPLFSGQDQWEFNALNKKEDVDEKQNKIYIAIHTPKDLLTGYAKIRDEVNMFSQTLFLAHSHSSNQDGGKDQERAMIPIIHISLLDFQESLSGGIAPSSLPRSFPILDSSIWNYLVFINKDVEVFKSNFIKTLEKVYKNYKQYLYSLEVSCEYADLNARLLNEAFLRGGHAKGVSPFIFHSETSAKKSVEGLKKDIGEEYLEKLRWRFLLLDDKVGDECLSLWLSGASQKTKTDIIVERIKELGLTCSPFDKPQNNSEYQIEIVYAKTVDEAFNLIKEYQFDIILLDYLLKDDYGYRLLKELEEKESNNEMWGPHGELYFMFISAFTTAVSERLTFEGLSRNKRDRWQIGEGACPTNTPELFKYRLLQLMGSRLRQMGILELSYKNIFEELENIFSSEQGNSIKRIKSVRERASMAYKNILGYHYDYNLLKKDEQKSVLVESFLKDRIYMGALLEHLLQLVHLIAFGTVRQWPEIWEEYQSVFRVLNASLKNVDEETEKEIKNVSVLIEKHIIDLKSL